MNSIMYQKCFNILAYATFFSAFIQVTVLPIYLLYIVVAIFLSYALLEGIRGSIDRPISTYLLFYNSPFILSLFLSLPISFVLSQYNFFYDNLDVIGRVFNLVSFSAVIILIETNKSSCSNWADYRPLLLSYWLGVLILLLTAIWHYISETYGFLPFPFETRSYVHSTDGLSVLFSFRLTGIAEEPSYLVTYMVDFVIITLFLFKKKLKYIYLILGLVVLYLSYSPSGYIILLGSFIATIIFYGLKHFNRNTIIYSLVLLLLLLITVLSIKAFSIDGINYFIARLSNSSDSGRFSTYYSVLGFFKDSGIFNILFGYGMKSFPLLTSLGLTLNDTSNNMFIDVLIESGVVGLILLSAFYVYVFRNILKIPQKRIFVFASLLFFDLLISSFIKADYASLRGFILIYLLYVLSNKIQILNNDNRSTAIMHESQCI